MEKKKRLSIGFTEKELNQISNLSAKLIITPAQLIRQFVMKKIEESSIDELENTFNFSDCEDKIINAVCKSFQVQKSEITRKTRKRYIVDARTCAAYIMRNHLGYGVVQISTVLRKHHSSIIHMVGMAEKLIEYDKQFKMRYEDTVKLIYTFEQTKDERAEQTSTQDNGIRAVIR